MWDFSFQKSFSIVAKTWPFLVMRIVVFGIFALVFCILLASGAIIGHEIGPSLTNMGATQTAIFGTMAGFGLAGLVPRILREYTLYLVKAGHIAVMSEMLAGQKVPSGFAQLSSGAATVKENFAETSTLFVLDQLIKAVLKTVEEFFKKVGMFIPFLAPIFSLVQSVLTIAITYIDEMILAHIMRTRPANAWRAAADALVLYAQNAKFMFKNAFWLAMGIIVFEIVILATIYFLLPVPEQIATMAPDAEQFTRVVAALVGVVLFALIFVEPFAVCTMLQAFNMVANTQRPDPNMERKLIDKSPEFNQLASGGGGDFVGSMQAAE